MKSENKVRIIAIVVAVFLVFTAYSFFTKPVYITEGMKSYQQGYFGSSQQISNGTMVLSAFNDNETLLFYSDGLFVPYFRSSDNSSLHGNYYVNLSSYMGHIVGAYGLHIGKEAENVSQPWTGITFSVGRISISTSDPFVYIPPPQVNYPNSMNGKPYSQEPYISFTNFNGYPILSSFPVNHTLQFWVNFTLTPIVELGPYYLQGASSHVSITWNLTFINKA